LDAWKGDLNQVLKWVNPLEIMSENEWDEHDRRVAEEKRRLEGVERQGEWLRRRQELCNRGCHPEVVDRLSSHPRNFRATQAVSAALTASLQGITIVSGNVGCGKTFAGHVWLLQAQDLYPHEWRIGEVQVVSATEFARTSRYGEGEKFQTYGSCIRLLLDDLGTEHADKAGSARIDFDELLDQRYRKGLGTFITTNLTADVFKERYGDRIASRVREHGRWAAVREPDLRRP
jgi:chromosomal replication initiation ATPase DnaA